MSQRLRPGLGCGIALVIGVMAPVGAGELFVDARTQALEGSLYGARTSLHEAPRGTRGDLDRIGRELRSLQIRPSERDVEVERLERALTDLEHDADRLDRRLGLERSLRALRANPARLAPPDAYRPPYPGDIRGTEHLIGVGKQVVLVQRALRNTARELALARHAAAGRYLAEAEGGLARLEGVAGGDPNVSALRHEADRLRDRLGPS